jgi:hypothetical protein
MTPVVFLSRATPEYHLEALFLSCQTAQDETGTDREVMPPGPAGPSPQPLVFPAELSYCNSPSGTTRQPVTTCGEITQRG